MSSDSSIPKKVLKLPPKILNPCIPHKKSFCKIKCDEFQKKLCGREECEVCLPRSFASHEKAKYWSSKNIKTAFEVRKGTDTKYLFDCECGHEITLGLAQIYSSNHWCKYCAHKELCDNDECNMCLENSFASMDKAIYWSPKNKENPRQVYKRSHATFLFDCHCGHEILHSCYSIAIGQWCKYCKHKDLCDNNECKICYERSFASHKDANTWSKKNNIIARKVFKHSSNCHWFDCICGHETYTNVNHVTVGSWCGYCSNPCKRLCADDKCQSCFNKSFASHEKAKYWSKENSHTARQVIKNSNNDYLFHCIICNHEIKKKISSILTGTWCPYCAVPSRLLCGNIECKHCLERSFASQQASKYWSSKNELNTFDVFSRSQDLYYFTCEEGHPFVTSPNSITCGHGCPVCVKKTEKKLYEWLGKNFGNFHIESQKKWDWCFNEITSRLLPFDFYITEIDLIIELDGDQHFNQIMKWKSPELQRKSDIYKMVKALNNNKSIIRILQNDVYHNLNDWENKLLSSIKKYTTPEVIFFDNNNKYEIHSQDLVQKLLEIGHNVSECDEYDNNVTDIIE